MRRALRKSMPFVGAILIGAAAAAFLVSLAVLAAHS